MAKYGVQITGGIKSIPISQRQRARVLQMLDVEYDQNSPITELSQLIYNDTKGVFELMPAGGIMGNKYGSTSVVIDAGITDYDVLTIKASDFSDVESIKYLRINTDATITVKLNSTDNQGIQLTTSMNPFEISLNGIDGLYITTSASAANVNVLAIGL